MFVIRRGMFLLSLTATCQVYTVSLKAGLYTYNGFAGGALNPPDREATEADTRIMGVARQASTAVTACLVGKLEAKSKEKGHNELNERFAIAQQLQVSGFILEIDGHRTVCSGRFGGVAHVSPLWYRVLNVMRHDAGNALKLQENRDGIGTLPLNPLECGKFARNAS
jgi:hypothetical protein